MTLVVVRHGAVGLLAGEGTVALLDELEVWVQFAEDVVGDVLKANWKGILDQLFSKLLRDLKRVVYSWKT